MNELNSKAEADVQSVLTETGWIEKDTKPMRHPDDLLPLWMTLGIVLFLLLLCAFVGAFCALLLG